MREGQGARKNKKIESDPAARGRLKQMSGEKGEICLKS